MILVTGAHGFLGRAVVERLRALEGDFVETYRQDCNLCDAEATYDRVGNATHVINCAALCGGLAFAGQRPADLFRVNVTMGLNLIDACTQNKVRLVTPIANCVYPGDASVFREEELHHGPVHSSVRAYASARRAYVEATWAYAEQYGLDAVNVVLPNGYGPGDHFGSDRAHALGAIIAKVMRAKLSGGRSVELWGTGDPVREWIYVDDMAEALVRAVDAHPPEGDVVNVGTGRGITIRMLAETVCSAAGWDGEIRFDASKPDGARHKTLDGTMGAKWLGWSPEVGLEDGIRRTIAWVERHPEVLG